MSIDDTSLDEQKDPFEAALPKLIKTLKQKIYLNKIETKSIISDKLYKKALVKSRGNMDVALSELKKEGVFKEAPQKQYYTIEITGTAPVTLTYRVFAEDPQQALQSVEGVIKTSFSSAPKINFSRFRKIQGKVFKLGTSMIEFMRNF